jgi:hypothetical protein
MSKYRTQTLFMCPYCSIAGFFKRGQRDAHVRNSHPDKLKIEGTGWDEKLRKFRSTPKKT